MGKNNTKYGGEIRTVGICRICDKKFDDYDGKAHRKYICRECFNYRSKMITRKHASTLEGYLKNVMNSIKHNPYRTRYDVDIDLNYLIELYSVQDGKCAISGIQMEIGYGNADGSLDKIYRNPYNLSVDRVDGDKGYTKDNVILVCNCVNFFKNNLPINDVFKVAKTIGENEKYYKNIRQKISESNVNYMSG